MLLLMSIVKEKCSELYWATLSKCTIWLSLRKTELFLLTRECPCTRRFVRIGGVTEIQ